MSGPVPSPSMYGMIGSSGTAIRPSWYSIRVPLIARATLHNDAATRHAAFGFGQFRGVDDADVDACLAQARHRARVVPRDHHIAEQQHVGGKRFVGVNFEMEDRRSRL